MPKKPICKDCKNSFSASRIFPGQAVTIDRGTVCYECWYDAHGWKVDTCIKCENTFENSDELLHTCEGPICYKCYGKEDTMKCDNCHEEKVAVAPVKEGNGGEWCDDCINAQEKLTGTRIGHCIRCGKEKEKAADGYYCPDFKCRPDPAEDALPAGAVEAPEELVKGLVTQILLGAVSAMGIGHTRQQIATVMLAARYVADHVGMTLRNCLDKKLDSPVGCDDRDERTKAAIADADALLAALKEKPEEEEDADGQVPEDRH